MGMAGLGALPTVDECMCTALVYYAVRLASIYYTVLLWSPLSAYDLLPRYQLWCLQENVRESPVDSYTSLKQLQRNTIPSLIHF